MRVFVGREPISPEEVQLDRVRWEQPREKKAAPLVPPKRLYLELQAADLSALGEKLHRSYRQILDSEPDFFLGELMEDVPRPGSPRVFLDRPFKLKSYLKPDSWWREETIRILLGMLNPWGTGERRYWIEEFVDVKVDGEFTIVIFEARLAGVTGPKPKLEDP